MKPLSPTIATLALLTSLANAQAADLLVTISEETTRITKPLKPDGYPDYVAALNEVFRQDTTPDKNLAVGIWKVTGPVDVSDKMRPHFFQTLGMDDLPPD